MSRQNFRRGLVAAALALALGLLTTNSSRVGLHARAQTSTSDELTATMPPSQPLHTSTLSAAHPVQRVQAAQPVVQSPATATGDAELALLNTPAHAFARVSQYTPAHAASQADTDVLSHSRADVLSLARAFASVNLEPQQGAQGDRPVEETRKNIQVLKGLPESQLFPVMNFMSASLGTNCAFCHVNAGGDNWEWEKDDKPEKLAGRRMIQMVLDINKTNFRGRNSVTCYSCHRGQEDVARLPTLPRPVPEAGASGEQPKATAAAKPAPPTVDQVLERYVQAIGGRAAFEKLKTRVERGEQTTGGGMTLPIEVYYAAPNKVASYMTTPKSGVFASGYNGTVGWTRNQRGQRELGGSQLEEMRRSADFYADLHLKELYPNLSVTGKTKVGEREAYVLTSRVGDKRVERFFFDVQTGLLLRIVALTETMIVNLPEQTDFEDYREVDGVKLPFTIRQSYIDPWNSWTRKLKEIRHNVPVDDAKFAMPPAPPAPSRTPATKQ